MFTVAKFYTDSAIKRDLPTLYTLLCKSKLPPLPDCPDSICRSLSAPWHRAIRTRPLTRVDRCLLVLQRMDSVRTALCWAQHLNPSHNILPSSSHYVIFRYYILLTLYHHCLKCTIIWARLLVQRTGHYVYL